MEKELLAIIAVLKECCTALFSTEIHIHTDHKNLTCQNLNTQCIIHWHLCIEEFAPKFHCVKGSNNIVADYLSQTLTLVEKEAVPAQLTQLEELIKDIDNDIGVPPMDQPSAFSSSLPASLCSSPDVIACLEKCPKVIDCFVMSEDDINECFMSAQTLESFLNMPAGPNPMDHTCIAE